MCASAYVRLGLPAFVSDELPRSEGWRVVTVIRLLRTRIR
jgi:hypothetical protein